MSHYQPLYDIYLPTLSRDIGGVLRPKKFQHFSHFIILPIQVAPFSFSIQFFADSADLNLTKAVESTGTTEKY